MAAVEVSGAPGEIVTTQEKFVDPTPATKPQENSVPEEDSAAKETPTVEKLDETSEAGDAPDQLLEEKPNGVEETLTKETGETAAEKAVVEETPANETSEVKEETPEVAAAEVTEEPKDVFVVKAESDPEVESAAIVEAPPAKEDDPEASEEPEETEKAPEVDGAEAEVAE